MSMSASQGRKGLDIAFLLIQVLRNWPLILALFVLGIGTGHFAQKLFTPVYKGVVSLLIDPRRPNSFGPDAQFGALFVDAAKVNSVGSIIESSSLLGRVVQTEKLSDDPVFGSPQPSLLQRWFSFIPFLKPAPVEDTAEAREMRALLRLSRGVRTTRVGLTYVMQVEVSAYSPAMASRLAEAVVDAYLDDQRELKVSVARRDTEWMTQQIQELRAELIRSEEAVEEIRRKYGLVETDRGANSTTDRQLITELNAQVVQAQAEVAARQGRYEQVQHLRSTGGSLEGLPEVTASKVIADLRLALSEATRKLEQMTRNFTPSYVAMNRPEDDVRHLRAQIAAEAGRIADGIVSDYQSAVARRNALADQLARAVRAQETTDSAEGRAQLRQAQRVVEANRTFYEARLNSLRDLQQQQSRQEAEARVISPAAAADTPSFPKPLFFLAGGAFLGLGAGTGLALLRALLRSRLVRPEVVEDVLSLPVLARIPLLPPSPKLRARAGGAASIDYLASNPLSPFADSIRMLRAGLHAFCRETPKVVLVTSAVPGEGKSTVAASLALSHAVSGRRTVLVDVDVRKTCVSNMFRLPSPDRQPDHPPGPIVDAIQPFSKVPLHVLSAGIPGRPRPDMIDSPRFHAFIRELASNFDMVVLDSPPVLLVSDGIALSAIADATILVAAARSTPVQFMNEAIKLLRSNSSFLAGVVLNKTEPNQMERYYRSAYASYYGPRVDATAG
jgi:capsular exopolysaccharide synthesis family protein